MGQLPKKVMKYQEELATLVAKGKGWMKALVAKTREENGRVKSLAWPCLQILVVNFFFDFVQDFAVKYFRIVPGERFYTTEQGLKFFGEVSGRFSDHFSF